MKGLVKHSYILLGKADKGIVTGYLMKITGYSRAHIKRLIQQYVKSGTITVKRAPANGFKRAYTDADIRLLANMDERHGQPSGAVLKLAWTWDAGVLHLHGFSKDTVDAVVADPLGSHSRAHR